MAQKNTQLEVRLAKAEADMEQMRKELADANEVLIQFRGELEQWKHSVLGFREEIRDAQAAELEALRRVLKLLGGQEPPSMTTVSQKLAADRTAATTTAPAGDEGK